MWTKYSSMTSILVSALLVHVTLSAYCTTNQTNIPDTSSSYEFNEFGSVKITSVMIGPVSSNLYYMGNTESPHNYAIIRRVDSDTVTEIYTKYYPEEFPAIYGYNIDQNEEYLYSFLIGNPSKIMKINTSDGSISLIKESNVVRCTAEPWFMTINNNVMWFGGNDAAGRGWMCTTDIDLNSYRWGCTAFTRIIVEALYISQNEVYFVYYKTNNNSVLWVGMIDSTDFSLPWNKYLPCIANNTGWGSGKSHSLLHTDLQVRILILSN